jgi:hypothetical protein
LIIIRKKKKNKKRSRRKSLRKWKTHQIIMQYPSLKNVNWENILWHVDPLLEDDREVRKYTTAVTEQRLRKQACFHSKD